MAGFFRLDAQTEGPQTCRTVTARPTGELLAWWWLEWCSTADNTSEAALATKRVTADRTTSTGQVTHHQARCRYLSAVACACARGVVESGVGGWPWPPADGVLGDNPATTT